MSETNTPSEGQAVVVVAGRYANEPGVVLAVRGKLVDVGLARSFEVVTVRATSLQLYG